jgi:hypothetical protein
MMNSALVPDAVQRVSDAPQIRDRSGTCFGDPGSAVQRYTLRCAREKY